MVQYNSLWTETELTTGLCFKHTAAHAGFQLDKASMDKFSEHFVSVLPTNEPPNPNQRKEINQSTDLSANHQ